MFNPGYINRMSLKVPYQAPFHAYPDLVSASTFNLLAMWVAEAHNICWMHQSKIS